MSEFKVWPFVPAVRVEPDPQWAGKVFHFQEMAPECAHDWRRVDCVVDGNGSEVGRFESPTYFCPKCRAMREAG